MPASDSTTSPVTYKLVPEFPDYRVGDDGSVWSRRIQRRQWRQPRGDWRQLALPPNSRGYPRVLLYDANGRKLFCVHTLVLTVFVGPRPEGMEACHNDGVRTNNRLDNLRWDTHVENMKDMDTHGRSSFPGASNPKARLTEDDVLEIKRLASTTKRMDLARKFGVTRGSIQKVLSGRTWKRYKMEPLDV